MTLLQEYKNSLKMAEVEEIFDLIFYRPVAFGFVKLVYRLPITPNQVTLLSLLSGWVAAYCFSLGTGPAFMVAGLWFALANILDCSDGQLARLQNSGTPLGRLVDGVADWAISVAIFVGLGLGLTIATGTSAYWYLVALGGASTALHAIMFDYYQQEYISNVRGRENFLFQEIERIQNLLTKLQGHPSLWWKRLFLHIYFRYLDFQRRSQFKEGLHQQFPPDVYRQFNGRIMRWWTLLGSTTNRTLLIIAGMLWHPEAFLWIIVIPGNLYLAFMLVWQRKVQRQLEASVASSGVSS